MSHTATYFHETYDMSKEEYEKLENFAVKEEFFKELSGHTVLGPGVEREPDSKYEEMGIPVLKNKLRHLEHGGKKVHYIDKVNDYFFNSEGFRSEKEFDGSEELIFTGCSHTFGEGVPEEAVWGAQVARGLGMSYANLGRPAVSAYWAVGSVFSYLKRHKAKPKVIVALMPDFKRFMTVRNPLVSSAYVGEAAKIESEGRGVFLANHWADDNIKDSPKYLERPFAAEYTTSKETAFMQNMRAIQSLELYCSVAGIKFLWSTWSPKESILFSSIKKDCPEVLESYIDIKATHWPNHWYTETGVSHDYYNTYHKKPNDYDPDWTGYANCFDMSECSGVVDCHKELHEKYGENFYRGTDRPGVAPHPGVHKQTHYAEEFLKNLKES
jgi:hypothetical protein